jgi:hypothetical protein
MSVLTDIEDWFIRQTMKPTPLETHPVLAPHDDAPLAFAMFVSVLFLIVTVAGHCIAP